MATDHRSPHNFHAMRVTHSHAIRAPLAATLLLKVALPDVVEVHVSSSTMNYTVSQDRVAVQWINATYGRWTAALRPGAATDGAHAITVTYGGKELIT